MISTGIILTKSYKNDGFCVTVYDENKKIIRLLFEENPKSSIPKQTMNNIELLDKVEFKILKKCDVTGPQTENVLIDKNFGIRKIANYRGNIEEIYQATKKRSPLIFESSVGYITEKYLPNYSLLLAKVSDFNIYEDIQKDDLGNERIKYRARFTYNDVIHEKFSVTDPMYRKCCYIKNAYVLFSLPSTPYSDGGVTYHKFVAAIYDFNHFDKFKTTIIDNVMNYTKFCVGTEVQCSGKAGVIIDYRQEKTQPIIKIKYLIDGSIKLYGLKTLIENNLIEIE